MKKFDLAVKVGNDTGNSELDMIINKEEIRQANVYGRVIGGINLEELDQDKFIENLEDNLIIGICDSEYIESGDYYIGNYTLRSGARVRNIEVGEENRKVDSDVCFINTLALISAYAVKQAYKENKDVKDINVKIDMTGALPITQYSKAEGLRFANKFMGTEHRVTVKTPKQNYFVTLNFEFVRVIPEGVTTTFALISDDSEKLFKFYNKQVAFNLKKNKNDDLYKEELHTSYFQEKERRILHVAIGEGTTEFPITEGITFDPNFVEGLNNGVGHAIKTALPLFNREFRAKYSRQMFSDVVKDKEHKYHADALEYLSVPLEDEAEVIYRKAVEELEKANNEVDLILVYGGGSILMRKHLEKKLEKVARKIRAKLLYIEEKDAVMLEANGLYNFVNSALFEKLKETTLAVAK